VSEQGELLPKDEGKKRELRPSELQVSDGTSLDVAVSTLIKELRRGNEAAALYWAMQLNERFWRYVWRRLLIFCSEDVGLANNDAIVQVLALREAYMITKEESRSNVGDVNFLAHAVFLLARSPKNKETGFAHMMVNRVRADYGWRPEVPDYALDMHTKEGRERRPNGHDQGRHWLEESSIVLNQEGPLDWEAYQWRLSGRLGLYTREEVEERIRKWNEEGKLRYGLDVPPGMPDPWVDPETGEIVGG